MNTRVRFTMTALERKGNVRMYLQGFVVSWVSNLIGAVFFAGVFTYLTGILSEEPFKSGTTEMITSDIVEKEWRVIFLRAIMCGYLVRMQSFIPGGMRGMPTRKSTSQLSSLLGSLG